MKATAFNWFCLAGISLLAIYTPQAGITYKQIHDVPRRNVMPESSESDCFPKPKNNPTKHSILLLENDKSNTMQAPDSSP